MRRIEEPGQRLLSGKCRHERSDRHPSPEIRDSLLVALARKVPQERLHIRILNTCIPKAESGDLVNMLHRLYGPPSGDRTFANSDDDLRHQAIALSVIQKRKRGSN